MTTEILYFDCLAGISGDMFMGACVDVGAPTELLRESLQQLRVDGFTLEFERVRRGDSRIDYSAWSPVGEVNFHRPDRFGIVTFGDLPTAVRQTSWAQIKSER